MKNLLLLIALLVSFASAFADGSTQYSFQQIDLKNLNNLSNGLSLNVSCMTVSHEKGYVWIGTRTGIGRFDGYELKKYLQGTIVTDLVEDKENTIWATTRKGLYYYDYQADRFIQATTPNQQTLITSSIALVENGVLFGGHGTIFQYTYQSKDKQIIPQYKLSSLFQRNITQLIRWDEQHVLCANRWNNAVLFNLTTGETRPTPFNCNEAVAILTDSQNRVWVSHYNNGVKCYNKKGELLHSYHTRNSALKTNVVLALEEHNGEIWIATDGNGIYILNPENDEMTSLQHVPGQAHSLPGNSFSSLYNDAQNHMWAGSVRNGLIRIKEVGMRIYGDALPGSNFALSEKSVLSLYQDSNNDIYIGTDGGGMNRMNPSTQSFTHLLSTYGDKIASITGADREHLLVSLFSKGVFFFNKRNESYRPLIIVNDSINRSLCLKGKTVNVHRNTPETVLLLSDRPYLYHLKKQHFTPIVCKDTAQVITGPLRPVPGAFGAVTYLYNQRSIYTLPDSSNQLKLLYQTTRDTLINSVSVDDTHQVWIGTNYGLACYHPADRTCQFLPNSLVNYVSSVLCDHEDRVWIGTEAQLFAYLPKKNEFIIYGETDGIYPNEYLDKPRLLSRQGDIYMGGVEGLLRINHQLPYEPSQLSKLAIADVLVGGERVNAINREHPVLHIKEKSKPITVKLIAVNKDMFRKPIYRYTLQGMDGQVFYSYLPEQTFTGLPAGKYQVLAACNTRLGGWTDNFPILELHVHLPWYKTGWFYLLLVVGLLGLFFFILYSFFRKRENRLKIAMKEKEKQIYEEKVRLLININHELRTPLTLIHAPLKQLLNAIPAQDKNHQIVERVCKQTDRMKSLLNMVLNVRKMEVESTSIQLEPIDLRPWLEALVDDFKSEAEDKGVKLNFQSDERIGQLCIDKEKCTTAISNLLINALKYSSNEGTITVSTRLSDDETWVRVSIADEGTGLKGVDTEALFNRFYQAKNSRPGTGIGLSYAKILIEQQGGHIGAYDNGDKPGATFWVELPVRIQPEEIHVKAQPYLNELLASTQEVESVPQAAKTAGKAPIDPHSILIVDDNQDLTDYLQAELKNRFKKIEVAVHGEEALLACKKHKPDIVVSDIQMPVMNGYELCRNIKQDLEISHIPVILLTARIDEESRIFGYKNGADDYLSKPFEIDTLCSVIRSLLANRDRVKAQYMGTLPLPQPEEATFSTADEEFLKKLNKLINDNLNHPEMGVNFLCSELGMSRASLYNKLKTVTGMGASDYITKLRLEQAVYLLTHSSLKINEISDQTGFSTSRYFSTAFKQYMGCTPSQYKEKQGST